MTTQACSHEQIIAKLATLDCGDNSCIFRDRGKTGGMRTNGGCQCLRDISPRWLSPLLSRMWQEHTQAVIENLHKLCAEIVFGVFMVADDEPLYYDKKCHTKKFGDIEIGISRLRSGKAFGQVVGMDCGLPVTARVKIGTQGIYGEGINCQEALAALVRHLVRLPEADRQWWLDVFVTASLQR